MLSLSLKRLSRESGRASLDAKPFASVYGMTHENENDDPERFRTRESTGQLSSSTELAAHHDRWLKSLPADATDMSGIGPDGNLYFDDDASFWLDQAPNR